MDIPSADFFRVQARELIADVTHPITWATDAFRGLSRAFSSGDMYGAFSAAFSHGATLMVEEVKARCPTDSGALRDSIHATTEEQGEFHGSGTHSSLSVENTFAYVVAGEEYAYYVEYGTAYMAAEPFMRPAVDQGWTRVASVIADLVVTSVVTAFWGRLVIGIVDIGLMHAGPRKQKHTLGHDIDYYVVKQVIGARIRGAATGRTASQVLRGPK